MKARMALVSRPMRDAVEAAERALARGGVGVFPTETFYGLGCPAVGPHARDAVERVVAIKGRDASKAMPLIAADREAVLRVARDVPAAALALMDRFWPGPLTLVLPAVAGLPFALAPEGEVGVRVSPHPLALLLARAAGGVLVATSANLTGRPPVVRVADLDSGVSRAVDFVLDGGDTPGGAPSTVVRVCADGTLEVLRPGAVALL
jgi:L-threonylcarbamoyladenylate synthase